MKQTPSDIRKAENEAMFRKLNMDVPEKLKALSDAARAEGEVEIANYDLDQPLHFYCECADENCKQRIVLKPSKYYELHQNSSQFVIVPGHTQPEIEQVVNDSGEYVVVEKYMTPPRSPKKLNRTDADNT